LVGYPFTNSRFHYAAGHRHRSSQGSYCLLKSVPPHPENSRRLAQTEVQCHQKPSQLRFDACNLAGPDAGGEGFQGAEAEFFIELDGGVVDAGDGEGKFVELEAPQGVHRGDHEGAA